MHNNQGNVPDDDDDDGFADFQGGACGGYAQLSDGDDSEEEKDQEKEAEPEEKVETSDDKIIGALNQMKIGNPDALNKIFTDDVFMGKLQETHQK